MLKRAVSLSIYNHRFFSTKSISNRNHHAKKNDVKYRTERNTIEKEKNSIEYQFNRYNVTRLRSAGSSNTRKIDDDDIFSEEKDNLTIIGTDIKAFSAASSSKHAAKRESTTNVSLSKKFDNLNIPLEVLIQPDLRDLYTDEDIHQSMEQYINELRPALRPFTFDLAYLINESATLKRFIEMGVDVYRWNQPHEKAKYVLTLNFDNDCVQHLVFLNELGIKNKDLSDFLSYNPWIFKETIDDLRVRMNYLEKQGFSQDNIRDMNIRAPYLLNLSTKALDTKLNWFRKKFDLKNNEIREFALRAPKLLTLQLQDISRTYFQMNTYLDFQHNELKQIFKEYPKLFLYDYKLIELNFDFLYNEMNLERKRFLEYPPVLKQSFQQLRTRCLYLKYVQRNQFDPTKPNFVSLKDLCLKTNELFCQHVTKTSIKHYLDFMKTL